MTLWESDDRIVPLTPGNAGRGKAVRPTRESSRPPATRRSGTPVNDRLDRITTRAESDPAATFNNVYSLLNTELLFYAFRRLKRDKAPGVDGVTVEAVSGSPSLAESGSNQGLDRAGEGDVMSGEKCRLGAGCVNSARPVLRGFGVQLGKERIL